VTSVYQETRLLNILTDEN